MVRPRLDLNAYFSAHPKNEEARSDDQLPSAMIPYWDESMVVAASVGMTEADVQKHGDQLLAAFETQLNGFSADPSKWLAKRTIMMSMVANRLHAITMESQDDPTVAELYSRAAARYEAEITKHAEISIKHRRKAASAALQQSGGVGYNNMDAVDREATLVMRYSALCEETGKPYNAAECQTWVDSKLAKINRLT